MYLSGDRETARKLLRGAIIEYRPSYLALLIAHLFDLAAKNPSTRAAILADLAEIRP